MRSTPNAFPVTISVISSSHGEKSDASNGQAFRPTATFAISRALGDGVIELQTCAISSPRITSTDRCS